MLKRAIKYIDFDGKPREDILYFNLTEPEVVRLDVKFPGGLEEYINNLDEEVNPQDILSLFEEVIRASYGEKSDDGRYFVKDPGAVNLFYQSAAYSALFVDLIKDADKAASFFNGLLSKTTVDPVEKRPS
jgi:hypothetical protein